VDEEIPEEEMKSQIHMVYNNSSATENKLQEIKQETSKDNILTEIANYTINGWPKDRHNALEDTKKYWSFREDISLINGILYKGQRIIIPQSMQKEVKKRLHQAHQGIEKTKLQARETVYWMNINKDIEDMVKTCDTCHTTKGNLAKNQ
jgi:hypothetical protein